MPGPVTRIGITGHRQIPDAALSVVRSGIRAELLAAVSPWALSSLAAGADQVFAEIALECGAPLTAVIPGMDYETHLGDDDVRTSYRRILKCCAERVELPYERTHEEAYDAAGRYIVDRADRMIAVWDGAPSRGLGGTADIVAYARRAGVPVTVLWNPGVRRP
ncbi:uncharacterized protein SGFS_079960 [Streptomyces graminofaciens]|uniref:Uncharacterized protein n=1 Tax=Streptomyces graminofaciens TaxID=68212 RepID=A0ABM7FJ54_9ACTN|nr:hypothetical protein [Streptomyces graminofaciens]BBC36702.1 uncharacterized protein SGFS_079960 [Streptomyces graminofaciens]